jgi:hypothetical protein
MDAVHWVGIERDACVSIVILSRQHWDLPLTQATPFYKDVIRDGLVL